MVCGGRDDRNSRRVGTARGETEDMAGEPWFLVGPARCRMVKSVQERLGS